MFTKKTLGVGQIDPLFLQQYSEPGAVLMKDSSHGRHGVYRVLTDTDVVALLGRGGVMAKTLDVAHLARELGAAFPALRQNLTRVSTFQDLVRAVIKTPSHAQTPAGLMLSRLTGIPPNALDYIAEPYRNLDFRLWHLWD